MPANKYKIWGAIGSPVFDGVSASVNVGVATIAKKPNVKEPNIIINELACNLIARSLFLPCPPGILLDHGGDTYFCSMNFNLAGQALPPIPVQTVLSRHPRLSWGIILFDVLMMNPDRHGRNLAYDRTSDRLQIFDHSRAFLPLTADIDSIINDNAGKLGLVSHCLQSEIANWDGFDIWSERIKALPDFAIDETVSAICKIGFPSDKSRAAAGFLKSRRDGIDGLVTTNIGQFPKLQPLNPAVAPAPSPPAASTLSTPSNNP
jgi:hypothetical protein